MLGMEVSVACKTDVIIIGGGFAGLYTAAELSKANVKVTLVEASDYLGGRVKQVHPFKDCPLIDVGGEFIHGNNTEALRLAKQHGWKYEEVIPEDYSNSSLFIEYTYANGKLCRVDDDNDDIFRVQKRMDKFIAGGTKIRRKLKEKARTRSKVNETEDLSDEANTELSKYDCSLATFLSKSGEANSSVAGLCDAIYCQSEGNDMNKIGMLEFSRADVEWQYGSGDFRLKKTYRIMLDHVMERFKDLDIELNWQVKSVMWEDAESILVRNQNGDTLSARYVVITVPLRILQDGDIHFMPELPVSKSETLKRMEMRNAFKMFCCFSRRFWPGDMGMLLCAESTPFMQIWNEFCYDNKDGERNHILCGFATASLANQASESSKNELKERFLNQLNEIFGTTDDTHPATDSFIDFFCYDWQNHPFVRGGYASPVVGSHAMSIALSKPIDRKLFFAGEATNFSSTSTVQAAIDSGIRAANEVLECINNC